MSSFSLDVAHMLAGGMVLVSFMLLYQDRMFALLNVFALHAVVLSASVAWQAHIQNAPHLYVPAVIALVLKGIIIPVALHRVVIRLGIHRGIETVVGIGPTLLFGVGLTALSMVVMLKAAETADPLAREDLAFALSILLLGLLMMVTRRNAVSQIIGFMSIENGLILAATAARGMPLVGEISVAFRCCRLHRDRRVLFCIRERFDSVELQALTSFAESGGEQFTHPLFEPLTARCSFRGDAAAGATAELVGCGSPQRAGYLRHSDRSGLARSLPPQAVTLFIDDLNNVYVLTTFVAFTTSVFSASYISRIEIGRLTPIICALPRHVPDPDVGRTQAGRKQYRPDVGGVELATLTTVLMVGITDP